MKAIPAAATLLFTGATLALSLVHSSSAQTPSRQPTYEQSPAPEVVASDRGNVISVTPVVQQVTVPRRVCHDDAMVVHRQPSGAGALIGAIAGGAMGNAIGAGSGRAAATAIGVIGGAAVGNSIEAGGAGGQEQTVRRCSTQTSYEDRTTAYSVVYEYAGRQYTTQMRQDPGRTVQVRVQALAEGDSATPYAPPERARSAPRAASRPPPMYVERPVYQEDREPAYRSYPAPAVVYDEPVAYGRGYYEPAYPQFGTGLVLGALIGYGAHYGVNRHYWRGGYRR